jgi:hypothetical protein
MPSTRDLLQRFRPAAAPGAATATGVPADRAADRAAELARVFAALAGALEQAEQVRHDALTEAGRRREEARVTAAGRVAQARIDADSERDAAVGRARDEIAAAAQASTTDAEQRVREITEQAARTRQEDIASVVAAVRARVLGPAVAGRSSP